MRKLMSGLLVIAVIAGGLFFFYRQRDNLIARVGKLRITISDFQERMRDTSAEYRDYLNSPVGKEQLLEILLKDKVVLSAAYSAGLAKDKEIVQSLWRYRRDLKRRLKDYKENLLIMKYLERLREGELSVTAEEITAYYNQHKQEYQRPKEVRISHILLSDQEMAKQVQEKIAKGEDFANLAREYSLDPESAERGGDLGFIKQGEFDPQFEAAAFELQSGIVSDIVKTPFGYHLLKKTGEEYRQSRSFAEVKEEIRRLLEGKKFEQWLEKKRTEMDVQVNYKVLGELGPAPEAGLPVGLPPEENDIQEVQ